MQFITHTERNQQLLLTADRTIFWEEEHTLILSDLHLGKSGHFRKNGIGIPQAVMEEDLRRLTEQLLFFNPRRLIVVGDLFHSRDNREHSLFLKWREEYSSPEIHLIKGNHDILSSGYYLQAGIQCHTDMLSAGPFLFCHDKTNIPQDTKEYAFTGHIHPGISIQGKGRQCLKFPCFYFGKTAAILPAFGRFTGLAIVESSEDAQVFPIVENTVIAFPKSPEPAAASADYPNITN